MLFLDLIENLTEKVTKQNSPTQCWKENLTLSYQVGKKPTSWDCQQCLSSELSKRGWIVNRNRRIFLCRFWRKHMEHKPTKTLPPENKRSAVRWDDFFAILPPYRLVVVFLKDFCIWKHLDPWGGWNMIQFDEGAYVSKNCGKKPPTSYTNVGIKVRKYHERSDWLLGWCSKQQKDSKKFMLWKLLASFLSYLGKIPNCNKRRSEQLEFSLEQKTSSMNVWFGGRRESFKNVAEWI